MPFPARLISALYSTLRPKEKKILFGMGGFALFIVFLIVSSVAAWITHIVSTIMDKEWIFLAIGAFIPPVGVIHGWMVWFGLA